MVNKVITPLQQWLLSKGKCPGCGMSLRNDKKDREENGQEKIVCQCGRIFIYNKRVRKYQRVFL